MVSLPVLSIIIAAFLWALEGVVLLPELSMLNVAFVVFLLHGIGFLILNTFSWKEYTYLKKFTRSDWIYLVLIALFGGAIGTLAIVKALFLVNFTQLSVVVLLQKLQPVFAIFLAYLLLKEKPRASFYFWAAVAIFASYFMTFGLALPDFTHSNTLLAALFALIAAFSFGASTVFGRKLAITYPFRTMVFYRYGLTSVIMLVYMLLFGNFMFSATTPVQWSLLVIIPLTTGLGSMFLYYYGLRKVRASISTICELFFPLSAIVLDYLFHGTVLSVVQWIAVVVLLFAILQISGFAQQKGKKKKD